MIPLGSPHVRCTPMGHTCGEPNEIELTGAHGSGYRSFQASNMFQETKVFNQPLNSWQTSSLRHASGMFDGCHYEARRWSCDPLGTAFNQDIDSWQMGNATDKAHMFSFATKFNQPLNSWHTELHSYGVYGLRRMFTHAYEFNQPLDAWRVDYATDVSDMLSYTTAFNQGLNSWQTSSVKSMAAAFRNASAFNQPLSAWQTARVAHWTDAFEGASALSGAFKSDMYQAWQANQDFAKVYSAWGALSNSTTSTAATHIPARPTTPAPARKRSSNIVRVSIFLDFVRLATRAPHVGPQHVRGAKRN